MAVTHQMRLDVLKRMGGAELALPSENTRDVLWSTGACTGRPGLCAAGAGRQPSAGLMERKRPLKD